MISLGGGYPNPATFAYSKLSLELDVGGEPISLEGDALLKATQYGPSEAFGPLDGALRSWHRFKDGVELEENGLLVLNGSQEGLYMLADVLLDEEDAVMVSEPTYPGAIACFRSFTENLLAIPMDGEGERVDVLEALLSARQARGERMPKLLYSIPTGHNPSGVSSSLERRKALVDLARRFNFIIADDDPYQLLSLDPGERVQTLQSLAPERVVRLDSFSKILAPGLRLGYLSGPSWLVRAMVLHKQASNLHTSSFAQAILAGTMERLGNDGMMRRIASNVELYRGNRDAMHQAARRHLPSSVRYNLPRAGMFMWFELPEGCDSKRMLDRDAQSLKVILVPGSAFSTRGGCRNAMRASFSMVSPEQIEEGMRRFGEMLAHELEWLAAQ
jgi:DNA-binding transcriptional MocR family regulator